MICTMSLNLIAAPVRTAVSEQVAPGATGGTARSKSSGIQFSLGFRVPVSDVVLEFAGPNAGASASVLLLNTPDFWANDGIGPNRQAGRKTNTAIRFMVPRILLASTPCEPRADGPNPPECCEFAPAKCC